MFNRYSLYCLTIASLLFSAHLSAAAVDADTEWQFLDNNLPPEIEAEIARHETGAVAVGTDIYLIGGRRNRPTLKYDSIAKEWTNLGLLPSNSDSIELHHFQPVAIGTNIYVLGSLFGGSFPDELSDPNIRVLDTLTNTWSIVGQMPAERLRGSASAVVRDDIIYLVGGNTQGHNGGFVPWMDSYNPSTGEWIILPDAPNARDHFSAAIINNKLIAAAGRQSISGPNNALFNSTIAATDVYDFDTGQWSSGADIVTERAGAMVASAGQELLVAGGEIGASETALLTVEAYDVVNDSWRPLHNVNIGRHSGGGVVIGTQWHVFSGSTTRGGGVSSETSLHETLELDVPPDSDNDGLTDLDETNVHGTDPSNSDTDDDNLFDGPEVNVYETNPLSDDSDGDGLKDGEEVFTWGSDPNVVDTDGDRLNDGDEVSEFLTSPTKADTDDDNLDDSAEIVAGTDPNDPDTDGDGLLDGDDPSPLVSASSEGSEGEGGEANEGGESNETNERTAVLENDSGGATALWLLALLGCTLVVRSRLNLS